MMSTPSCHTLKTRRRWLTTKHNSICLAVSLLWTSLVKPMEGMNVRMNTSPTPYSSLTSVFPPEYPAGLRGEAVRSSLRDPKRGLFYDLTGPAFQVGILHIESRGLDEKDNSVLDFLHAKSTNSFQTHEFAFSKGSIHVKETCLLTARGRITDILVAVLSNDGKEAYVLTSPFHGSKLFQRLDPFVFPMDGIKLTDCCKTLCAYSVVSTTSSNARSIIQRTLIPALQQRSTKNELSSSLFPFPQPGQGCTWTVDADAVHIIENGIMLPSCVAQGYTIIATTEIASFVRDTLFQESDTEVNEDIPMEISSLEWDSLRVEAGRPAYGYEMTSDEDTGVKSGPLELHLKTGHLNLNKGCYQGQEGVSAILNNRRGLPRTLYSVVFDDDENFCDGEMEADDSSSIIRQPRVGDGIFVLGSNESIRVGVLTSVAEPGGTGKANTVALALVRRPDTIWKKMKEHNLDFGNDEEEDLFTETEQEKNERMDGIIAPPPMDPLHGLEIIVGGTYTIGKLKVIPMRQFPMGNMYDADIDRTMDTVDEPFTTTMGYISTDTTATATITGGAILPEEDVEESEEELARAMEEATKAAIEAEFAAADAKRKADKMEMLRERAEAAMAARKKKKQS